MKPDKTPFEALNAFLVTDRRNALITRMLVAVSATAVAFGLLYFAAP